MIILELGCMKQLRRTVTTLIRLYLLLKKYWILLSPVKRKEERDHQAINEKEYISRHYHANRAGF